MIFILFTPLQTGDYVHICSFCPYYPGEAAGMDATYNWPAVRHILFRAGPGDSASSIKDVAQAGAANTTRIGGAS